jgi:hypothetical protein
MPLIPRSPQDRTCRFAQNQRYLVKNELCSLRNSCEAVDLRMVGSRTQDPTPRDETPSVASPVQHSLPRTTSPHSDSSAFTLVSCREPSPRESSPVHLIPRPILTCGIGVSFGANEKTRSFRVKSRAAPECQRVGESVECASGESSCHSPQASSRYLTIEQTIRVHDASIRKLDRP